MKTFAEISNEAKARVIEVDRDYVASKIASPDVTLIDVREQDEYRGGHIPGALGIGRGVLEYHIADIVPDADHEIILYCRGGNRSALAADALQQMGYTRVRSMEGGFREWNGEYRAVSFEGEPILH